MSLVSLFLNERRFLCGLAHSMAHRRDLAQSFPVFLLWHQEAMLAFQRTWKEEYGVEGAGDLGFSNGSANG